jgi:ATP-dependent protease ClpP protease subunit
MILSYYTGGNMKNTILVNKFNEDSAAKFDEAINEISAKNPDIPIIIRIDSYGGYIHSLSSMIASMESVPNIIVTYAVGKAMSCGAILLSCGDYRFANEHCDIMIHEVSSSTGYDNVNNLKNSVSHTEALNKKFMGILAENMEISFKDLKDIFKEHDGDDIYLTTKKAKKLKIIDYIGCPCVSSYSSYSLLNTNEKDPVKAK